MEGLVQQAMEEGALGLTTALIYAPNAYAKTPELIDLAKVSARCGGTYIAHIRNESSGLIGALQAEPNDVQRPDLDPADAAPASAPSRARAMDSAICHESMAAPAPMAAPLATSSTT
jgi:N-acyl-D-aspartate/D-glutamate deacylase